MKSLKKWFWGWVKLKPHFIIGNPDNPYLLRYYVLPRNRLFNIYLHKFLRSDDDRALHNHPWVSLSILLSGEYFEEMWGRTLLGEYAKVQKIRSWRWFFKGMGGFPIIFRKASHTHRVELIQNRPVWTLFITGPKVQEWGFFCEKGWVHWKDFVAPTDKGQVGKGCD